MFDNIKPEMKQNMILSLNKTVTLFVFFAIYNCVFLPLVAFGQGSQTITVSPTLFDIKATPGQTWTSEIKIVNNNLHDLTVYLETVNFTASEESGRPAFIPINANDTKGETLAEWIEATPEGVFVPKQKSVSVPFSVTVPVDAPPGGHYAAILVGTKPNKGEGNNAAQVQTSQFVTSLLFLKVDGTIIEKGLIRSFVADKSIVQTPEASFTARFENQGNVHLQPQGDIQIFNMWGQERGVIPVNQRTQFGKVLKETIREYNFGWKGDVSLFDLGRYTAIMSLTYGEDQRQTISNTTYFWVIPYSLILFTLLGLTLFFGIIIFSIKLYIKSVLESAGVSSGSSVRKKTWSKIDSNAVVVESYTRATVPIRKSLSKLSSDFLTANTALSRAGAIVQYVMSIRLFWLFSLAIIGALIIISLYYKSWSDNEREFEVSILDNDVSTRVMNSEQVFYERLPELPNVYVRELSEVDNLSKITVEVYNQSGVIGTGAKLTKKLESFGLSNIKIDSDFTNLNDRTVIVYSSELQEVALALRREFGEEALISAESTEINKIKIFVGKDLLE